VSPDFDEIIGADDGERERLHRVHELLVTAGPPPELTPRLERTPATQSNVFSLPRVPVKHRATLLFAAAIAILAVFLGGYAVGHVRSTATRPVDTLALRGTSAPNALASLQIFPLEAGNWPMTLTVQGLPRLPAHAYYDVYLVRNGKPYLSCGEFTVDGGTAPVTVKLNAPYVFERGDTWVVTKQLPGEEKPGRTVLKPV
jgi:hypothetical protein